MKNLAKKIKTIRQERNISPLDVARKLAVDLEEVLSWEEGTKEPSVEMLKKLSLVYNISLEAFFKEEEIEREEITNKEEYLCLWCERRFSSSNLAQKDPYPLCFGCQRIKENNYHQFKKGLKKSQEKIKKRAKSNINNTLWLNYIMIISFFLLVLPFTNSFNNYRGYLFILQLYLVISSVNYLTLLHFKGFIYKSARAVLKTSFFPLIKLLKHHIKGLIVAIILKAFLGIIFFLLALLGTVLGNLFLLLMSPLAFPFTVFKYRRSVSYESL